MVGKVRREASPQEGSEMETSRWLSLGAPGHRRRDVYSEDNILFLFSPGRLGLEGRGSQPGSRIKVKSKHSNGARPQMSSPGYTSQWLPMELGLPAVCVCVYTEGGQGGRQELHSLAL